MCSRFRAWLRIRLYMSPGGASNRRAPRHGAAASTAFTMRLSETGYAVPSECAK